MLIATPNMLCMNCIVKPSLSTAYGKYCDSLCVYWPRHQIAYPLCYTIKNKTPFIYLEDYEWIEMQVHSATTSDS